MWETSSTTLTHETLTVAELIHLRARSPQLDPLSARCTRPHFQRGSPAAQIRQTGGPCRNLGRWRGLEWLDDGWHLEAALRWRRS
jgi:hypothetical protein